MNEATPWHKKVYDMVNGRLEEFEKTLGDLQTYVGGLKRSHGIGSAPWGWIMLG